jgi:excisionase family DNA binding protein
VNTPTKWWKADDVAEMLDTNRYQVYHLARLNLIPHARLGRSIRFNPERIMAWLEAGGTAANGDEAG